MKTYKLPNKFIVITNKDGDVLEKSSLNEEIVRDCVKALDKKYPENSPHSSWSWNGELWCKLKD